MTAGRGCGARARPAYWRHTGGTPHNRADATAYGRTTAKKVAQMAQISHAPPLSDPGDEARRASTGATPATPPDTFADEQPRAAEGQGPAHNGGTGSPPGDRGAAVTQQTPLPQAPPAGSREAPSAPPPPRAAAPALPPAPRYTPPQQTSAPAPQHGQQYQQPAPQYGRALQPAPQQPGYPAPQQPQLYVPRATRKAPPARVGRRLLRRTVMGVSAAFQAIFGVRPLLVVAFLALLGFTAWLAFDRWLAPVAPSLTPNAPSGAATVTLPPEAPTILTYLDATKKGDANAVWETLGTEEKVRRLERGDDKSVLAGVFEFQQQNGVYYSTYHFIGARGMDGTEDTSRGGMFFYVADVKVNGQTRSLPLLFTVDDKGHIVQVDDALYSIALQQIAGGGAP